MKHLYSLLVLERGARALTTLGVAALLALSGCRKDTPKETPPEGAAGSASAAKTAKAPQRETIEVPTEEDFEDAAEKEITPETDLAKALDEIEKQVAE